MATNHPVVQTLFPTGNVACLAAGSRPSALAVGQVGFFNIHTGLSIDGSVPADCEDFQIAVGRGTGGVLSDVDFSAGQMIQRRHLKSYTFRGYVAGLPKIVDIAGFAAKCETDYGIKLELRNAEIYALNGYNQFTKPFFVTTGCCADQCAPCADGNCNEIAKGLVDQINLDSDALVTAQYIVNMINATVTAGAGASASITVTVGTTAYIVPVVNADTAAVVAGKIVAQINTQTDSPYRATNAGAVLSIYPEATLNVPTGTFALTNANGTGVTVGTIVASAKSVVTTANYDAFIAANPGVCLGIRLTTNPAGTFNSGDINLKYYRTRGTDLIVSLVEGFVCNGTMTTVQELQNAEGDGYDLRQDEYEAGGFNGRPGPYRQSSITGMARSNHMDYQSSLTAQYNQFILTYDIESVGGFEEYKNNEETIIAVPCADATAMGSIVTFLDTIIGTNRFGAMAGDVTQNGDCTNARTNTLTAATDGIESIG